MRSKKFDCEPGPVGITLLPLNVRMTGIRLFCRRWIVEIENNLD
jgi:hypothetical protein